MNERQHTIKQEVKIKGMGLRSGEEAEMSLRPLPEDKGIIFQRTDLADSPLIKADMANLVDTHYSLTLKKDGAEVTTIEHLLAVLSGLKIDNVLIEIKGREPPIFDGSALALVELLKDAGREEQSKERQYIIIQEPLWVTEGDAYIVILPSDEFKISYTIDYAEKMLDSQYAQFVIDEETFIKEIAPARTFCFMKDVEGMKKEGLIKGGSLQNSIVIDEDKILTKLRFEKEFVCHKMLDLIGDLALLGRPVLGHLLCAKGGHALDARIMEKILQRIKIGKRGGIFASAFIPKSEKVLDINKVMEALPHRYPFLLVDRIIDFEEDKRVVAIKNVSINEPFFQGHFPGQPVMPGVLIVEGMAQAGGVLLLRKEENAGKLIYFAGMDKVKFRRPVVPGDQLRFELEMLRLRSRAGKIKAEAFVEGKCVAEGELTFSLVEP